MLKGVYYSIRIRIQPVYDSLRPRIEDSSYPIRMISTRCAYKSTGISKLPLDSEKSLSDGRLRIA